MKLATQVWLTVFVLAALSRVQGQESSSPPVSPDEETAQKEKDGKKKPPDKEKQAPPAVAFDVPPPQNRMDLSDRQLPRAPEMLGDLPPPKGFFHLLSIFTTKPVTLSSDGVLPGTREFKVADNGSPRPQDRVYASFGHFDDLFPGANHRPGDSIGDIGLFREYVGLEKTFLGGIASLDIRMPINTLVVESRRPDLNGSHTDVGDLSLIFRYALYRDDERDNWLTTGLAVTAPTGPRNLGGITISTIPGREFPHSTILQPFVAYLWNVGDFYLQGFSALDTPTDDRDVVFVFNDIGIGYFVYRTTAPRFLTAVAPAFEVHVTNPTNHLGKETFANPLQTSNIVDLGLVANLELNHRSRLSFGVVTPVTGPKPFNTEALVQFRVRY
jgi:hypothetical protein